MMKKLRVKFYDGTERTYTDTSNWPGPYPNFCGQFVEFDDNHFINAAEIKEIIVCRE